MKGLCPKCKRSYEMSEEFLAMGGTAKCPHCMLKIDFSKAVKKAPSGKPSSSGSSYPVGDLSEKDSGKTVHPEKNIHRASRVGQKPVRNMDDSFVSPFASLVPDLSEQSGEHARVFDIPAEEQQADEGVPSIEDSSMDLPDLRRREEPDFPEEEEKAEVRPASTWSDATPLAEYPAKEEEAPWGDETPKTQGGAEERKQPRDDATRKVSAGDLEESGKSEQAPGGGEEEAAGASEPEESVPEEAQGSGEEPQEKPSYAEFEEKTDQIHVDAATFAEKPQPASKKAAARSSTSQDWANAAAQWAAGGFKTEDAPDFLQAVSKPPEEKSDISESESPADADATIAERSAVDATELDAPAPQQGAIGASVVDSPSMVEVSESDILVLEEPEQKSFPPAPKEITAQTEKPRAQKADELVLRPRISTAVTTAPKKTSGHFFRMVLFILLFGILVVGGGVAWLLLGPSENIETMAFPAGSLKAKVVIAPPPKAPVAKEKAKQHYGMGNRLAFLGKFEGAIIEYQQALREDPTFPHPHRALGAVYAALGKKTLSADSYGNYIRLMPDGSDAEQVRQILKEYQVPLP
jgi:hypothetical protein